jgi:hypothetical protein
MQFWELQGGRYPEFDPRSRLQSNSMNVPQIIEGPGVLESFPNPDTKIKVNYKFEITTIVENKPGFPPLTRTVSKGTIRSLNGEPIERGYYRLITRDEVLKVQNLEYGMWVVLGS